MERRQDHRHGIVCTLSLKCLRTRKLLSQVVTENVSATGLALRSDQPHRLRPGDRVEVQLKARVPLHDGEDLLVMGTHAMVLRAGERHAALRFEGPLAY